MCLHALKLFYYYCKGSHPATALLGLLHAYAASAPDAAVPALVVQACARGLQGVAAALAAAGPPALWSTAAAELLTAWLRLLALLAGRCQVLRAHAQSTWFPAAGAAVPVLCKASKHQAGCFVRAFSGRTQVPSSLWA